jgi:pectate lyase
MKRIGVLVMMAFTWLAGWAQTTGQALSPTGQTLAFPTAEGFGKYASGGRGGKVVEVTTLADSGEGSLRWALTEAGREDATIVFRVSGIIDIGPNPQRKNERSIRAKLRNVTIAGQTAPGKGILLRGGKLNLGGSENVIIRNIRGRLGVKELERQEGESDEAYKKRCFIDGGAIGIENARNIIIDHCCFGWSGEENMTMYDNHFTTVQWCIIHEGLHNAGHKKGVRGYGAQWSGSPATFHHNLLAHNDSRSPRINGASNPGGDKNVFLEYINNVNYNWGRQNSCYGGENEAGEGSTHLCNFIGNYYKPGPAHPEDNVFVELSNARKGKQLTSPSIWYFSGNVMEGTKAKDNWQLVSNKTPFTVEQQQSLNRLLPQSSSAVPSPQSAVGGFPADIPLAASLLKPESAKKAYEHVLAKAGTIHRDAVEQRIVDEVRNGTALYQGPTAHKKGIIDNPADVGGWPTAWNHELILDSDHDGMPDSWERTNGLDPTNPDDRNLVISKDGYTALEVYLCSLMGEKISK